MKYLDSILVVRPHARLPGLTSRHQEVIKDKLHFACLLKVLDGVAADVRQEPVSEVCLGEHWSRY